LLHWAPSSGRAGSHQRKRLTSGCASRLEHPPNAGIHFLFFDEFTALNLIDSNLYLFLKPFVMSKQAVNGLLHQFISSASRSDGQLIELSFLTLLEMDFHAFTVKG
jgi:hypothetical protein